MVESFYKLAIASSTFTRAFSRLKAKFSQICSPLDTLENEETPGNVYDGCPLVLLLDDEGEDGDTYRSYLHNSLDENEYFSILRLSHKYNCEGLKLPILRRLTASFINSNPLASLISPQVSKKLTYWAFAPSSILYQHSNIEEHVIMQCKEQPELSMQFLKGVRLHSTSLQHAFRRIPYICLHDNPTCQQQGKYIWSKAVDFASDSWDIAAIPISLRIQLEMMETIAKLVKAQMGKKCYDNIMGEIQSALVRDWRTFPEHYGFPSWAELDEMKAAALK
ncbi:hypothetical protein DL96DRAFT_1713094 [Flagelloscypha sp. PMI_526]|nr:hypothetical protein DL96DRAFT_1713094 [Flagelloscypha sp. PMI_526]